MVSCQKHLFSLPDDLHYLNCAYMSPLLRTVEQAGIEGIRRKRNPAFISPEMFYDDCDALRRLFARLVGLDDAGRIALVPSVSYGIAVVARNTRIAAGQNVVLVEEQFPSNVYSWRRACAESGAELRTVAPPETRRGRGAAWNDGLLAAIDEGTALVTVPHVHWSDGTLFDLVEVGKRAREMGALFVVDGTQSVGALPFPLAEIRPDALVCAGYKVLFGPYSLGLAYFGPRFDDGVPLEENWITREGSEDFAGLVDYRDAYQPGAQRYDVGERSNFILVPMLAAGIEQVLAWGPAEIQDYCVRLVREPLASLGEAGFWVEDERHRASHLFGIRPPVGLDVEALRSALARDRVSVSVRGSAVRVSPHVYNDAKDLEALRRSLLSCIEGSAR